MFSSFHHICFPYKYFVKWIDLSTGVSFFKKKEKKTVREALEESVEMLLQDGGKGTPSMVMKSLLAVTWKTETASSEPMNLAKEIFRQNLESVF